MSDGISVSGMGEVVATPDVALVNLGAEAMAETVGQAQSRATAAASAIVGALGANGVRASDITTVGIQIHPQYDYGREGSPRLIGYVASTQFTAKLRDLERVSATIDAAVTAGGDAARLQGISFSIDDPKALLADARRLAIADARARAETYADAAGVRVGEVLGIWEQTAPDPVRPLMAMRAEMMAADASIQPGETTISVTVNVRYALGGETPG